jgi:pimeloyl-ACP methyl ester carboxylesterase
MRFILTIVVLNIAVGAVSWGWRNTVAVVDFVQEVKFRVRGIRTERVGRLQTLVYDRCVEGKYCRCVALVHGLGDVAYTWGNTMLAAPPGTRVLAPNMPGTEGSPKPKTPGLWRIPAMAGSLKAALETQKECSSWTVAGNSLGGWTSSWLALRWPEGVSKLVLVGSAGLKDPTGLSRESAKTLAEPTVAALKDFSRRAYHKERSVPERIWPDLLARIVRRGTYEIASNIDEDDFLDGKLAALEMPVTVIWGESDRIIPPAQAARFKQQIPHAKVVIEEECGHLPQKECPDSLLRELY